MAMRLFPTCAVLVALAACGVASHPPAKERAPPQAVVVAPASVGGGVFVDDSASDARVVADAERVSAECQADPCAAGSAWIKAAAGHERAVMAIVERTASTEREQNAQLLAATALFNAQQRHELPDDVGKRVLALAATRPPAPKLATLLALLVVGVDAERLGLAGELEKIATRWPDSPFQIRFAETLRDSFPASPLRVQILRGYFGRGNLSLETSATDGLVHDTTTLTAATCEALAFGRRTAVPEAAVYAALRIAGAPCGEERERALADLEARVKLGPLPGIPAQHVGRLSYLCAIDLPFQERARSIATLRVIAQSRRQTLPIREEAMSSVRTCVGGDWKALRVTLLADPDPKVRAAVSGVDHMIIDW